MLERLFQLKAHNTTIKNEIIGGITTFLTMAYIIFVNPTILAQAGMDSGAVFVATCVAAAVGCFIMGIYANYPIALAPGMGLNAFFTYGVVQQMGYSWEQALGAVFLSGCVFILISIFKIREWVIGAIPSSLKLGIAAGIGLFLAMVALQNSGIIVNSKDTLVTLGDLSQPGPIFGLLGFFIISALSHLRVTGAVMVGILCVTLLSIIFGYSEFSGIISTPPSISPTFLEMDIKGAFNVGMISVVFAFLFVDLFDTSGTLLGVGQRGGLLDSKGNLPRLKKALLADSTATVIGAAFGTSSTTSFIESASGVAAGGRTGLTAVVVGLLFLLSLFFSPLAASIPTYATAGALLYVAVLMASSLAKVDWEDISESAPVLIAAFTMPLTYSIAHGIALSFISYAAIKLLSGQGKKVGISVYVLAAFFIIKYLYFT
ncbi:MAG: NCS2 family permease [Marinomonas sp.]